MDLCNFDSTTNANKGIPLELVHPVTKAKSGITLSLLGADSRAYRTVREELNQRNRAQGKSILSTEESHENTAEVLARCTLGWTGLEAAGKEVPFSQEKAKEIYLNYPEIADQVAAFIFTRTNFFQTASAS